MAPQPATDPDLEALLLRFPARELWRRLKQNLAAVNLEQPGRLEMAARMLGLPPGSGRCPAELHAMRAHEAVVRYHLVNPAVDLEAIEEWEDPGRAQERYRAAVGMLQLLADT